MGSFSIRSKLLVAFGVICLLSAGAASYSIHHISTMSSLVTRLFDGPLMAISMARSAQVSFVQARDAVEEGMLIREAVTPEKLAAIDRYVQQFRSDMDVVRERMGSRAAADVQNILDTAVMWHQGGMAHLKPPPGGLTELPTRQVIIDKGRQVSTDIETLVENAAAYGFDFRTNADVLVTELRSNLMLLAGGTLIFGLGLAIGIAYLLTTPLLGLTRSMKELADGNFDVVLPGLTRRDEIGQIAGAVEAFRVRAQARAAEETQRQLDEMTEKERLAASEREKADEQRARLDEERRRVDEERRKSAEAAASAAEEQVKAAEEQARAVEVLAKGLARLSSGDLTIRLGDEFSKSYERIKTDFNATMERLQETIGTIAAATAEVTNAAREIAMSTTDLSQRTDEQAAGLQETSTSMDQIAASVKKNAENARHANALASGTRQIADRSGSVVASAVDAMARIEESSRKIGDIIGVIDEIARQTNLLALNAAVEAARAGDAGRGFAVVASEVRSLAQRSSQAAKDIKDLITNSSSEVKDGVELVSRTGESLQEIVKSIREVADTVSEIAQASAEQAGALEAVNTSLANIDELTQRNSALVEENAATAKTLEQQSSAMAEQVGFFRGATAVDVASPPPLQASLQRPALARPAPAAVKATSRRNIVGRMQSALATAFKSEPDWEEF